MSELKGRPPLFPDNIQFWYETVRAFGGAGYGGSEFGEVLATVYRIRSGDFDSWYEYWNRTGERVASEAADQLARGHRISARDGFLRAATYHRLSEFFLHGNPRDPRIANAYRKSVDCYKSCGVLVRDLHRLDRRIEELGARFQSAQRGGGSHIVPDSGL